MLTQTAGTVCECHGPHPDEHSEGDAMQPNSNPETLQEGDVIHFAMNLVSKGFRPLSYFHASKPRVQRPYNKQCQMRLRYSLG